MGEPPLMRRTLIILLASGGYLGYAPIASGTVGTLYGVVLYPLWDAVRVASVPLYLATFVAFVLFSFAVAGEAEKIFGQKDSGKITIDEAAGYFATTLFLPLSIVNLVLAFFAFRLFDILKPWPANVFDRSDSGGVGVVADDVVAGLYANLLVRAILWLWA